MPRPRRLPRVRLPRGRDRAREVARLRSSDRHAYQPRLAARFEILSIPTILFVKDGRIVERVVGALPKAALQAKIQSALAA